MSTLWAIVSGAIAVIPLSFVWQFFKDRSTRVKAEAKGSNLTVKDGVQDLGDPARPLARVRWMTLAVVNWESSPITIKRVKLTWPPLVLAVIKDDLIIDVDSKFKTDFDFDLPPTAIKPFTVTFLVRLNWFLKLLPLSLSRVHAKVTAETVDAQRRRVSLKLRSNEVDWSKPPQEKKCERKAGQGFASLEAIPINCLLRR